MRAPIFDASFITLFLSVCVNLETQKLSGILVIRKYTLPHCITAVRCDSSVALSSSDGSDSVGRMMDPLVSSFFTVVLKEAMDESITVGFCSSLSVSSSSVSQSDRELLEGIVVEVDFLSGLIV